MPHSKDRKTVKFIFEEYLKCGSVRRLKDRVAEQGLKTPVRVSQKGRTYGGADLSRGHLHQILSNPPYIGKVRHKGQIYDGLHDGIIDEEVFEQVQKQLNTNTLIRKNTRAQSGSLLKGLLYDCDGVIYSPTYTVKKSSRYSYYISQNLIQYRDHPKGIMARIPAHEIEKTVTNAIKDWLQNIDMWQSAFPETPEEHLHWLMQNLIPVSNHFIRTIVSKITVNADSLEIIISAKNLRKDIAKHSEISINAPAEKEIVITAPFKTNLGKNGTIIIDAQNRKDKDPLDLPADKLKRIVRGIIWRNEHFAEETLKNIGTHGSHGENYVNLCIQESFKFLSQ